MTEKGKRSAGHKHYVPILKGKDAEFNALRETPTRNHITPLIEIVPPTSMSLGTRIRKTISKLVKNWGRHHPFFLDLRYIQTENVQNLGGTVNTARHVFDAARAAAITAIPVVTSGRSAAFMAAINAACVTDGRGCCIRLFPANLPNATAVLLQLQNGIGLDPNKIDLIIDLESSAGVESQQVTAGYHSALSRISNITSWRTVTIASTAFPLSLANPMVRGWNQRTRNDWAGWIGLGSATPPLARRPAYGDYTMVHPNLPPTGRATTLAQLRYTTPTDFLIYKGHDVLEHDDGYDQFHAICAEMILRPEYRTENFSWGDAQIHQKANSTGDGGSSATWRGFGMNHHIATVLDQIANLP